MNVSVIVCNLNGMKFLPRLIETLRTQEEVETEIIVVDRESRDGSREYMESLPDIKIVTEPASTGLVAGYHVGVRYANHELLFFCNEDMWLDRWCLARLARHLSLSDRIGAADPWQWSYDGSRLIHGGTRFYQATFDSISCYPPRGFDFLESLASGEPIPFGCAGAVLIHRQMYLAVGGWDTSFFLEFEDVDFFLRAWQQGWRCVVEPEAKVYHAVGMSTYQAGIPPHEVIRRRHVSAESNRAVICLKYFTGTALLWAVFLLLRPFVANLIRFRLQTVAVYTAAMTLTVKRLPEVIRFRKTNRSFSRVKPGQRYFTDELFQRNECRKV